MLGLARKLLLGTEVREVFHEGRAFALKSECKRVSDLGCSRRKEFQSEGTTNGKVLSQLGVLEE